MSERTFPDESTPRIGKSQTESGLIKNTHSYFKKDVSSPLLITKHFQVLFTPRNTLLFAHPELALRERKKYENTP
jgi:hypothetical protein